MCIVSQNFSEAVWEALQKVEEIEELTILISLDDEYQSDPFIIETNKMS